MGHAARLAIAIVLALGIGLGVPLLWVWIGSKLQGGGTDNVESTTAAIIFAGIVVTYLVLLLIAGWVQARSQSAEDAAPARYPWNRSMRDEPYRPGEKRLSPIESAFVFTAVVVTGAFMFWFFVFAGSPLPNQ